LLPLLLPLLSPPLVVKDGQETDFVNSGTGREKRKEEACKAALCEGIEVWEGAALVVEVELELQGMRVRKV
jgi:hypothetical protein